MTFEELLADAREANAAFRQYDRRLEEANCSLRKAKKRKSSRGQAWFEKGENVLVIGRTEWIHLPGRPAQNYVRIWSRSVKSFCLTPESCFR